MEKKRKKTDIVFALGFVGIIGITLTIISDLILLGRPTHAYEFIKLGTESMAELAQWRITVGAFVGVIALPFQTLGLIPIYYVLKPSGRVMPLIFTITCAHALIMGVAFHISYAFIGSGWKLYYDNKISFDILERFDNYWKILIGIMLIEIIFSSIIYIVILLKGKTLFSKWMAIFNPLFIIILVFPIIFILPAPIGGYIAPACLNLSTMAFVSITMIGLLRKMKAK